MSWRGWLGIALVVCATGCAKDVCDRVSPCPKDPVQTQADRNACKTTEQAAKSSPCFNETVAYAGCFNDNVACGADGTTDPKESQMKAMTLCSSQLASFSSCCGSNPTSAACK